MTKPLSVGVIGCGGIAQMMHLPTLAERPDLFRIAGLADLSRATLDAVGDRYHVSFRTTDSRELIARPDVEALVLAASGSHREPALATLAVDKHLFSEKPLGFGRSELDEIARAARKSRGRLMVGYHKRFDPVFPRARAAVSAIEDLRFVQVTVLHPDDGAYRSHHAILPPRNWVEPAEAESQRALRELIRAAPYDTLVDDIAGKGAPTAQRVASFLLYDSLIHDLNLVRALTGEEPEEVISAHHWNGGFAQSSVTRLARKVRATISWISLPGLRHYEETLLFVGPRSRVKLIFPSPYLRHQPTAISIERMDGGELVEEQRLVSHEEAFRAELHHFHRAITQGHAPEPSIEEAERDTAWIQAIAGAFSKGPVAVGAPREI